MKVAIVLPTLNRPHFLRRAMRWYRDNGRDEIGVIVVDSSPDQKMRDENHAAIANNGEYLETPHLFNADTGLSSFGQALEIGGKCAVARGAAYILHAGDDDFVLPDGILACAAAMDDSDERVVGCVGKRLRFGMKGATGVPVAAHVIEYPPLHQGRVEDRLVAWFRASYTLQFAAVRAAAWGRAHQNMADMPTWYFGNEIFPNAHLLFQGKFVKIPALSVAFQVNPDRQFGFDRTSMYDLVVKDHGFSQTMGQARTRLRHDFGQAALDVFDRHFLPFFAQSVNTHTGDRPIRYEGLKGVAAPPGCEAIWEALKGE